VGNNSKDALSALKSLIYDIDKNYIEPELLKSYVKDNISTEQAANKIYDNLIKK
jgi:hypothetical protein